MAFLKKQNLSKNSQKTTKDILPNQNNISAVLNSYLHSVSDMDMIIRAISNSYLFENSYDITSADIKSYGYLFKNFTEVILYSLKNINSIIGSKYTKNFNINRKEVNSLFTFFTDVHKIMENFIKNVSHGTNEKTIIVAINSISGAVDSLFTVVDKIFKTLPSNENLMKLDNFIEKTFTMLDNIIDNFSDSVNLVFKKLRHIFINAKFTKMFALNDTDTYKSIKENIVGVNECLKELFSGTLDNPEVMAMEMGRLLFTQVTGINYGRGSIMDSYVYVFETLKSVFWAADDAAMPAFIASKLKVWSILKKGVKGFKGVINEIFGTGGVEKGLLSVLTDDQLRFAFNKFTGIDIGRGATMKSFLGVFTVLRKIFIAAAKANIYAVICDKTKAFKNIKKGVKGLNEVITTLFGKGSSGKGFIPFLDDAQLQMAFNKYAGIKYGRGATMDLYSRIIGTLKSTFLTAIFTGLIAQLTIKLNTWENIKTAVKGLEEACSVTEESVESVLLDKYLGINEIAITQFNRTLLIELRKTFLTAIFTGLIAQLANKLKTWENIHNSVMDLAWFTLIVNLMTIGLYPILMNSEIILGALNVLNRIFIRLIPVFISAVVLSVLAKPLSKMYEPLAYGLAVVYGISLSITLIALAIHETEKTGVNIAKEVIRLSFIFVLLNMLMINTIILAIISLPITALIQPLLYGLGALVLIVASIILFAGALSEMTRMGVNFIEEFLKLTVIFALLIPMFTILIAASILAVILCVSMVSLITALLGLTVIALEINMISDLINKHDPVMGIIRLTIVMGLLWLTFKTINRIALLSLVFLVVMPFLMLALLGLTVIALEINMISNIINSQDTVKAQMKLTIAITFLSITIAELIAISLFAGYLIFILPVLSLAIIGIISVVLLMCLIIVPKFLENNLIKLNIVLALLLITGGILILINKAFELISIGKIILNVLALIGLVIALTILFTASLLLLPFLLSSSFVLIAFLAVITSVIVMAFALKSLEFINLDKNKIEENIKIITDSIRSIIGFMKDDVDNAPTINEEVWAKDKLLSLILAVPAFAVGLICVSAMLLLAAELWVLEKFNLDADKIGYNIDTINLALNKIVMFLKTDYEGLNVLDINVWKNDKLVAMFLMAPVIFSATVVISLLIIVAAELWLLEKIKIDDVKITKNVDIILGTINLILAKLFNKEGIYRLEKDENDTGIKIFGKNMANMFTEHFSRLSPIIDMILAVPMLTTSIIVVGLIMLLARNLKKLTRINFNEQDRTRISDNITLIFDTIKSINETLNAPHIQQKPAGGEDKSWWEKALDGIIATGGNLGSRIKDIVKGIMNTGTLALAFINTLMLSTMVEHLNTIATFNLKAAEITGKTKEIIDVCNLVAKQLNEAAIERVRPKKFEKVTNVIKMLSDSVTNLMNINTNQENVTPEGQIDYCLKPLINLTQFIDGSYKINGENFTGFSKLDIDGGWFDSGPYGKFKKLVDIENLLIESGKKLQELALDEAKVDTIVICLLKPLQKIISEVKDKQLTKEDIEKIEKYSTITSGLIETTRKLSTVNSVNFENYSKNVIAFIENINKNKSADFSALDTLVIHLNDMNKTTSELETSKFGNYVKLFKETNLINVSKIKTLKDNLKEITEYSKNMSDNFEKLSSVLSDKLVVVLEKMKTTLESLSGFETNIKVEEQKTTPQQSTNYSDIKTRQLQYFGKEYIEANLDKMLQFEKIKEQNIYEIRDTLDEISLILKSVKENTEQR